MLCGTAFKNKGVQRMLDAVIDYLPSPVDIPPVGGTDEDDQPTTRKADDSEKFAALAFKISNDPFVGALTFIRVYSGRLESGMAVLNSVKGTRERIGRLVQLRADKRDEISEVLSGDIGAATGLQTDVHARVLNAQGEPIVGLYACGNDMHSVMGGTYPAPGITIGPGIVFGHLAAQHASARAKGAPKN